MALALIGNEAASEGAAAPGGAGNELLSGVAKVLWEASAALARLGGPGAGAGGSGSGGALASTPPVDPLGLFPHMERSQHSQAPSGEAGAQLANAASALAQAAAALKLGQGGAAGAGPTAGRGPPVGGGGLPGGGEGSRRDTDEEEQDEEPIMTPTEFVETHGLESWVGEALEMLSTRQSAAVINPQTNLERARNPNGVIVSRIKQVAPVEQRVQMFVKVNDLAEGVVDRLGTLTHEQMEAVMETGLKIQKATNPSGVAMKRITEVLKNTQPRGKPVALVSRHEVGGPGGRGRGGRHESPGARRYHDRGRSWSRGRGRAEASSAGRPSHGQRGGGVGTSMPSDVQQAMEELGLENWCGEVLRRLSLWQRQTVIREIGTMRSVRNPSGVVMSRIRAIAKTDELLAIFIDINGLDRSVEEKLWDLSQEQRAAVMAPGIYVQNVRNASTAVKSRISNVVEGRSAMQRRDGSPHGRPPWRRGERDDRGSDQEDPRDSRRCRSSDRFGRREERRHGSRGRKRGRDSSSDEDEDEDDDSPPPSRRRRTR